MVNIPKITNTLVILASLAIIVVMSIEVLSPESIPDYHFVIEFQFWMCMIFIVDYLIRFNEAKRKWEFALSNLIFLLVSIPYLSIMEWMELNTSSNLALVVRYIPFVRAIYGFVIVLGYFSRSKITNLFYTYVVTILATTYFSSLLFYSIEASSNSKVTEFGDALWWAFMNLTTVGSDIVASSGVGRTLSVVLAASGMMLFPIFTAYITSQFSSLFDSRKNRSEQESEK